MYNLQNKGDSLRLFFNITGLNNIYRFLHLCIKQPYKAEKVE